MPDSVTTEPGAPVCRALVRLVVGLTVGAGACLLTAPGAGASAPTNAPAKTAAAGSALSPSVPPTDRQVRQAEIVIVGMAAMNIWGAAWYGLRQRP